MLARYMAGGTFYHMQAAAAVDNPDQRLAADVEELSTSLVTLVFTILRSLVELPTFSIILYRIQPLLCAALLAYATVGTAVAYFIGKVRLHAI